MRPSSAAPLIAFVANVSTAAVVPTITSVRIKSTSTAGLPVLENFSAFAAPTLVTKLAASTTVPALVVSSAPGTDSNLGYFYGFPEQHCPYPNGELWVLDQTSNNTCGLMNPGDIQSITLEKIQTGCRLRLYNTEECSLPNGGVQAMVGQCTTTDQTWKAWYMDCSDFVALGF